VFIVRRAIDDDESGSNVKLMRSQSGRGTVTYLFV
jgi:hypothetical protein